MRRQDEESNYQVDHEKIWEDEEFDISNPNQEDPFLRPLNENIQLLEIYRNRLLAMKKMVEQLKELRILKFSRIL